MRDSFPICVGCELHLASLDHSHKLIASMRTSTSLLNVRVMNFKSLAGLTLFATTTTGTLEFILAISVNQTFVSLQNTNEGQNLCEGRAGTTTALNIVRVLLNLFGFGLALWSPGSRLWLVVLLRGLCDPMLSDESLNGVKLAVALDDIFIGASAECDRNVGGIFLQGANVKCRKGLRFR